MNIKKTFIPIIMILAAAFSRLLPHLPNFTPLIPMALFGGATLDDKRLAFFVPLVAMFLSDLVIGLHPLIWLVYLCFMLITLIGFSLKNELTTLRIGSALFASAVLFFVMTNFGVWMWSGMYDHSKLGLMTCFIAALPFFKTELMGDIIYSTVLFGGYSLIVTRFQAGFQNYGKHSAS